ncbi:MAG: 3-isopropylmalate dehydratase small subunit [Leptolyngbyaceae cyanobacterium SM1_1_3]|nr:3-isopropylmalate dehydratase small subunit [Leptolyngbyaceae cyanobacterium SM1_1_3]NJM85788.1 3-isopropylmalate dehydratase small subunit [Leptolyngbyaceae cyanobacterium RM2_2_21]NJN04329.1 3-isopropylmalate dehydratase small subunit [Leptolyngbyaceae cyanobacterium RM1_1_2]NJO10562.1 3-isopropylmalate dehydratase small subunit [Leptolyngbyaceae cyanobacterium SL_1_1]
MNEVQAIAGRAIPLVGNDIDTDRIIPARFLRCVTFDGLGEQVFADDRAQSSSQHPFDQSQYQGSEVLIVNRNFGCGSSREHAPQAIARWGIRALIGESFAEIFFGNCVAMGIPCVTADTDTLKQLQAKVQADPQLPVKINLETMQVDCGGLAAPISISHSARQMFLSGTWDACGQLVANAEAVRATAAALPYMSWGKAG